jgi:hypothetical protein
MVNTVASGDAAVNNCRVRKLVGIVLILIVTLLIGADPISCPDGCTSDHDSAATEQSQAPAHGCVLCALGVETQPITRCIAPSLTSAPVASPNRSPLLSAPLLGIEHPPRIA